MQIQDFLNQVSKVEGEHRLFPFTFDVFEDEDTTRLTVEAIAEVNAKQVVTGFYIKTELFNCYQFSNECPCLIGLKHSFKVPVVKGDLLDTAIHEISIKYQDDLIKEILKGNTTDDLRNEELNAYEKWDRQEILDPPAELKEVVNYIDLSRWAAVRFNEHIRSWIHAYTP